MRSPLALVVTDREDLWTELRAAFASLGLHTFQCRGPEAPGYACTFTHTGRCALPMMASVIVLDCDLPGDAAGQGTSAWELLAFYAGLGVPVIALDGEGRGTELRSWDAAITLEREAGAASIARAARTIIDAEQALTG